MSRGVVLQLAGLPLVVSQLGGLQLAFATVFWPSVIRAQNGPQATADGCVISGHILDRMTGEPVHSASVDLTDASKMVANLTSPSYVIFGRRPTTAAAGLTTRSLDDGTFCFRMVQAGQYILNVRKGGFLDTSYGAKGYLQTGSIIAVGGAPLRHLDVALDAMSGIVGRVVDNYGDAVVGANVVALKQLWYQGRQVVMPVQGAQSDDRGGYRIGNLTPGTYFVYARPMSSGHEGSTASDSGGQAVRTYYPSALRVTNGAPVSVRAGQDVNGIDIRVANANTYHVRGRIDGATDEWPGATVRLLPDKEEPMSVVLGVGNVAPDGSFDFPDISPGVYNVDFESYAGRGQRTIEVEDADVSVVVHVTGNVTLHGRAAFEAVPSSVSVGTPMITLKSADAVVGPTYQVNVDNDGSIGAERIHPGKYVLEIVPPPGLFVKSLKAGTTELTSRELDLTSGGAVDLTIVFRYGCASLKGTVTTGDPDNAARSPYQVVLVLVPPMIDGAGIYFGATDTNGKFVFSNIPPGDYRVAALPEIDVEFLQNQNILKTIAGLGAQIDLQEKESKSVELTPVSNDTVEQSLGSSGPSQ